jgi:oxygen-dependent protoporphyrinogen oxidase
VSGLRVAVVGGGITGLSAAQHVIERTGGDGRVEVLLLEAGGHLGGKIRSTDVGGLTVEAGADSFVVRKPWAVDLCRRMGLEDRVIIPGASGAYVWTHRGLFAFPQRSAFGVPASVGGLLRWPGLSPRGRLRAIGELLLPPRRAVGDESLGGLARRRLGTEAARTLVEPLLAGLHGADPERQSVLATFPELASWERDHGSLIRASRRSLKEADQPGQGRKPLFASLWGGLDLLVSALAARIGGDRIRLDSPASVLSTEGGRYYVEAASEARSHSEAVILATPAFESARLLAELNPGASAELRSIPYASTAVVILAYADGTAGRLPEDGSGFVVPVRERTITACTWYSRKWPHETYGGRALVRCFVGRAGDQDALELSDDELAAAVNREVQEVTPIGSAPEASRVVRWERSMPQYEVGHVQGLDRIEAALAVTPGIFLAGSAYRGVGIADCVRQGREAAEAALAYLGPAVPNRTDLDGEREAITWTN